MRNHRTTLQVVLVLLAVSVAAAWPTRSHANSFHVDESTAWDPIVVQYTGEGQSNAGDPDGGLIKPPLKPNGGGNSCGDVSGLIPTDMLQWTWMYWRAVTFGLIQ